MYFFFLLRMIFRNKVFCKYLLSWSLSGATSIRNGKYFPRTKFCHWQTNIMFLKCLKGLKALTQLRSFSFSPISCEINSMKFWYRLQSYSHKYFECINDIIGVAINYIHSRSIQRNELVLNFTRWSPPGSREPWWHWSTILASSD